MSLTQILGRRLGLEPYEFPVLALMGSLAAILICAYTVAKVLRDALFLSQFGALALPYAYIAVALASVAFVWLEGITTRLHPRVGGTRFNQYTAIGLGALAALLLPIAPRWTIACFYVWTGSQAMMLLPHFWTLALDTWDSRRARQVFPVLAGCGLVGGLAGGALSGWFTPRVGHVGLMWIMAAQLVVAHGLTRIIESRRTQHHAAPATDAVSNASRWQILRRSRYIRIFAGSFALSVIVATLVDFQFKLQIQRAHPDPLALTVFLGRFYIAINGVALLFQFGAAGWLLQRLGLRASNGLQPASIMLMSAWVATSPGTLAVLALRSVQGVLSQTLGKSSIEIYYAAMRTAERRLIKPALDTLVERWSDAAVGIVLVVFLHVLRVPLRAITIGTGVLAAVWLVLSIRLDREFGAAFEQVLSSRWIEPEAALDSVRIPTTRRAMFEALQSEDESQIVLALELAANGRDPRVARAVRGCLRHPSENVRIAAVQAMTSLGLRDREDVVEGCVASSCEPLSRAAVAYLVRWGKRPAGFARRLLDGDDRRLQASLLDALFDHPGEAAAALTTAWIDARLSAGDPQDLMLAARALGVVRGRTSAGRLQRLLACDDLDVQREALRSAVRRPSPELRDALLGLLLVPELSYETRQAVAALGDPAVPGLRRLLDGGSGPRAQELAARTLARIESPRAIAALLTLVRGADERRRYLGLQALARMREHSGRPVLGRSLTHRVFLRELRDCRAARRAALALADSTLAAVRLLADSYREAAEMALERALQALACWYDPRPLTGVLERLQSADRNAAAPALEYLGHILPRNVFQPLRAVFEGMEALDATGDGAAPDLDEQLRQAWRSNDAWLRACALHAARVVGTPDPTVFMPRPDDTSAVRAEFAAWHGASPAPASGARAVEEVAC